MIRKVINKLWADIGTALTADKNIVIEGEKITLNPGATQGIYLQCPNLESVLYLRIHPNDQTATVHANILRLDGNKIEGQSGGILLTSQASAPVYKFYTNSGVNVFFEVDGSEEEISLISSDYGGSISHGIKKGIINLSVSNVTTFNIPGGAVIERLLFVVKTAIAGTGGAATFDFKLIGGANNTVFSSQSFLKDTKNPVAGANVNIATSGTDTNVQLLANPTGSLSSGEVAVLAFFRHGTQMDTFV